MSETSASKPASWSSDQVAPHRSSLFVRQAAFVAVMILLTGSGLTVAGYRFAQNVLAEQVRLLLNASANARNNNLLAYVGRQEERLRVVANHSGLEQLVDQFGSKELGEDEFQTQAAVFRKN